jgi:hypothetical protein
VPADGIHLGVQRWMNEFHGFLPLKTLVPSIDAHEGHIVKRIIVASP